MADTVNQFKNRLNKYWNWKNYDFVYDHRATSTYTGTGGRF